MSIPWEMDLDIRAAGNRTESFESDNSGNSYYWDSLLAPDVTPPPQPPLTFPPEYLSCDEIPPTPHRERIQPRRNVVSFSSPVATTIAETSNSRLQESTRTEAAYCTNPFHPYLFSGRTEPHYENLPLAPYADQPPPLPRKSSSFQVPSAPDRVPLPRMLPATPLTHPPPTSYQSTLPRPSRNTPLLRNPSPRLSPILMSLNYRKGIFMDQ
ncbi:uncharacterized protein [Prorops nasuta]|uniref:uncharacterized protein n=1 Tax=Prorops nasuta TaxID=863751 RepID=UPI0034CFF61D